MGAEVLGRADKYRRRTSSRSAGGDRHTGNIPTATKRILRRRFPGTFEMVRQVFKFVWRLCWKINVVCMSLSPFDSFQSRFVTYLLNRPRIMPILILLYWPLIYRMFLKYSAPLYGCVLCVHSKMMFYIHVCPRVLHLCVVTYCVKECLWHILLCDSIAH